jgi:ribose transport system permease protein
MFNLVQNEKTLLERTSFKEYLRKYNVILTLAVMIVISTLSTKGLFLDGDNILNVLERASLVGIIALGQMMIILTGGIDLSIAGILAVGLVTIAKTTEINLPMPVCILLTIIACLAAGTINGLLVAKTRVPPFLVTLATNMFFTSLALFSTGSSQLVYEKLQQYINTTLGLSRFSSRLLPTVVWIVCTVVVIFMLSRTRFGKNVYAVGGKEIAAKWSGIKNNQVKMMCYIASGMFCAVAGLILAYRIKASNPVVGTSFSMDSIAAVVLGGTNINGGEGQVFGTLVGSIIIASLVNLLNLLNADPYIQEAIKGMMLIAFVYFSQVLSKKN